MSSVRAWHERLPFGGGVLAGGLHMARLKAMAKGMRRQLREAGKRPRYGVRTQDLADAMRLLLSDGSVTAARLRAALAVGFCALMRGGELGTQDDETWDSQIHISYDDVTFFRDPSSGRLCAVIMMRPLKSEKNVNEKSVAVILESGGSLIDPVAELWQLMQRDPVPADQRANTPLFRRHDGKALCTGDVRDLVKLLMKRLGHDPARFGAHSLRIGGATSALAGGVSPQLIRLMGRWASDCYEIYLRLTRQSAAHMSVVVGSTSFTDTERGFATEDLEPLLDEFACMGDLDLEPPSDDDDAAASEEEC